MFSPIFLIYIYLYRIADVADITIQILTDAKQDRQSYLLVTAKLGHSTGSNIQILAERNLGNFLFCQLDPQLFITNFHSTHPFAYNSLLIV